MSIQIQMPKLADTMTEGVLVRWRKNVGDKVESGDVIAEIETDKATMDMEAFDDGIIAKLLIAEGAKVPVGEVIAILAEAGESAESATAASQPAAVSSVPKEAVAPQAEAPKSEPTHSRPAVADGARIKVSPLARKLAVEAGVDLSTLVGTGPGGRIVAKDIENAGKSKPATSKATPAPAAAPKPATVGEDRVIPLSGMRKVIAQRLLESKTTIPHFYTHIEIDAAPLVRMRSEINTAGEKDGIKLTFNDFVVKAVAVTLARHPKVNAAFNGDSIIEFASVNISVAVAIEDGLVTPVVRDAQTKSIVALSAAVKDLAFRARNKKLKPEEYQGGSFTISNLGSYGIDRFDAIINPPQSAILSVGNIVKKPVVGTNDQIVVGQRMDIGMSADHRVVDGAVASLFMGELRKLLENPAYLLM